MYIVSPVSRVSCFSCFLFLLFLLFLLLRNRRRNKIGIDTLNNSLYSRSNYIYLEYRELFRVSPLIVESLIVILLLVVVRLVVVSNKVTLLG